MRIVVTGGGSAGHVKPILAVASEIKALEPDANILFVRQIGDKNTLDLLNSDGGSIDESKAIAAGKFRRYHGVSWQKQALDFPMQLLNLRDAIFFTFGLLQSLLMLLMHRPDVVFVKGGYVGLPVGMAASFLNISLVIHESDAHMGLTNKILSKRSSAVGVGMPTENYDSGDVQVSFVGVPVSSDYKFVDQELQKKYKEQLGIDPKDKLVVITGGSHGAERVNNIVSSVAGELATQAHIIHQTGQETYETTKQAIEGSLSEELRGKYQVLPFIDNDMYVYLGAADVVVTRVGTTTMAELAIAAKPLVLIPNPKLVYGHQLKNAEVYELARAAVVIDEGQATEDPQLLLKTVTNLLNSPEERKELATNLNKLAKPQASNDIASLIISKA